MGERLVLLLHIGVARVNGLLYYILALAMFTTPHVFTSLNTYLYLLVRNIVTRNW